MSALQELVNNAVEFDGVIEGGRGHKAARELAAKDAEIQNLKHWQSEVRKEIEAAQKFAEALPKNDRLDFFVGGRSLIYSLIGYASTIPAKDAVIAAARDVNDWLLRTDRGGTAHQKYLAEKLAALSEAEALSKP